MLRINLPTVVVMYVRVLYVYYDLIVLLCAVCVCSVDMSPVPLTQCSWEITQLSQVWSSPKFLTTSFIATIKFCIYNIVICRIFPLHLLFYNV